MNLKDFCRKNQDRFGDFYCDFWWQLLEGRLETIWPRSLRCRDDCLITAFWEWRQRNETKEQDNFSGRAKIFKDFLLLLIWFSEKSNARAIFVITSNYRNGSLLCQFSKKINFLIATLREWEENFCLRENSFKVPVLAQKQEVNYFLIGQCEIVCECVFY